MAKPGKIFQIVLLVALVAAGINFFLNFRERRSVVVVGPKQQQVAVDPDFYVNPKKLHPQDLKDAKQLTQQPVWVREGYRFTYYPYAGKPDTKHPAGTLGPIEKLDLKDVVVDRTEPGAEKQVMAVFEKDAKRYAFPVGTEENGNYTFYSDDILFIQDPRQLYKHWSPDVWKAIDNHEVKPGMNELQASFAIGMGTPEGTGESNPRVVDYANNGHPVKVTYNNGKASEVTAGS
jgi:hypothetical protein